MVAEGVEEADGVAAAEALAVGIGLGEVLTVGGTTVGVGEEVTEGMIEGVWAETTQDKEKITSANKSNARTGFL